MPKRKATDTAPPLDEELIASLCFIVGSDGRAKKKTIKKLKKTLFKNDKAKAKAFLSRAVESNIVAIEGDLVTLLSEASTTTTATTATNSSSSPTLPLHKYILAPMVGASELPFRLLCRKYGAQIAYTPMISSARFCVPSEEEYRATEFQTNAEDRPLVAHFSANNAEEMVKSAKLVQDRCDAIDLNLGCPQRVAYVGHYGSYLLGDKDRELVLDIVKKTSEAISIPLFVKIRLLNTLPETIKFVGQLKTAGAALVAIHARYRASFERTGPGARDGAAMLDHVRDVKKAYPDFPVIANGNIVTHNDVVKNLEFTEADGVMSAEGILDNPAIFLGSMKGASDEMLSHAADPTNLALEYLQLAKKHPATIRTVAFHTRRMLRDQLNRFQLMADCIASETIEEVEEIVKKVRKYLKDPDSFQYDADKARRVKEEKERKAEEEGKRKRYEERMKRKAKREGKEDLNHYLNIGAELPSRFTINTLKPLDSEKQKAVWNASHGQHCMAYHLSNCKRGRGCAFLHCDVGGFDEKEEVAG
ncbi:hypothetical protein TL16_g02409 [Triparma laevis f. inornata]|uniref:tRNA-dihydrouridine(47) synthase [NAD(P)(+)] n=1 Tax=Triparma laevis f. inornata TaxID=1714386 RepID=A0A9W6ZMU7_9STRA|nr:hypothetical protein TL16_g02409 [Triparma laevis f. inornata]